MEYRYSHPVKLFEYMALKRAVLAPRLEGIEGIITDGENGFLYNWDSPSDFKQKLRYLIEHPDVRVRIGERAAEDVRLFDWPKLNRIVIGAFRNLSIVK